MANETYEEASASERKEWYKYAIAAFILALAAAAILLWTPGQAAADPSRTVHQLEDGQAVWTIPRYPAAVLQENDFLLSLRDQNSEPWTGAQLHIQLEMIGMICGDYVFELTEQSPGEYSGQGIPLMPGLWKATLTVKWENGESAALERTLKAASNVQ